MEMIDSKVKELLTPYQLRYWKNPEKLRAQQRAKYARYPKKIYASNRTWQKKNREHFNKLIWFGQKILKARRAGDAAAVSVFVKAREEYKKQHRLAVGNKS